MSEDRFATLRRILSQRPQEALWEELCALLRWWPEGAERATAIDYADAHLASWPQKLRMLSLWEEGPFCPQGEPSDLWRLARRVEVASRDFRAYGDRAAWIEGLKDADFSHITQLNCGTWGGKSDVSELSVWFSALAQRCVGLEQLEVVMLPVDFKWIEQFFQVSPKLQRLHLTGKLLDCVHWLSEQPFVPIIRELQLCQYNDVDDETSRSAPFYMDFLLDLQSFVGCESLHLQRIALNSDSAPLLAEFCKAAPLCKLSLSTCGIAEDSILPLGQEVSLDGLRALSLEGVTFLEADSLEHFTQLCTWSHLESLALRDCDLEWQDIELLAQWPGLHRLTSLDLSSNPIRNRGVHRLLAGESFPQLRRLELADCILSLPAAVALSQTKLLPALEELILRENDLQSVGVRSLAQSKGLSRLSALDVSKNRVYWTGYKALGESPFLNQLEELSIEGNENYFEGMSLQALSHHPFPPGLRRIKLSSAWGNEILLEQIVDFANCNTPWPILSLSFGSHALSAGCLVQFAKSKHLQELLSLDLSHCRINDEGLIALLNAKGFPSLQALNLSGNSLGDEGIRRLAASPFVSRLLRLSLEGLQLTEDAAIALSKSKYLTHLRELSLGGSPVGFGGVLALVHSPKLLSLSSIRLGQDDWNRHKKDLQAQVTRRKWPHLRLYF